MNTEISAVVFPEDIAPKGKQFLTGIFPAHLISMEKGTPYSKGDSAKSIPFNFTFKFAPEVAALTGKVPITNIEIAATDLAETTIHSKAAWLNPLPKTREEAAKNGKWTRWMETFGVVFKTITQDEKTGKVLHFPTGYEVLGAPVMITCKHEAKTEKVEGMEERQVVEDHPGYVLVTNVNPWEDGIRIDPDDLIDLT